MNPKNANCSFCRKSYLDVGPLVEGPGAVYICGGCVTLCQSIIEQEIRRQRPHSDTPAVPVRESLDQLVARFGLAKTMLLEAAVRRQDGKGRVLLIGPSRSSALLLAKAMAHVLKVPFATGDAVDVGKPGSENPLFRLLNVAGFDIESAKNGVVFLSGMERPDAQEIVLKLWNKGASGPLARIEFDTRGVLFVCGATFAGWDEAIVRLGRHPEQPVDPSMLNTVGARTDWVEALTSIGWVAPLDDDALARIISWVDFSRAAGPDSGFQE